MIIFYLFLITIQAHKCIHNEIKQQTPIQTIHSPTIKEQTKEWRPMKVKLDFSALYGNISVKYPYCTSVGQSIKIETQTYKCKKEDIFTEEKKKNAKLAVSMLQKAVKEVETIRDEEENIQMMITLLEKFIEQCGRGNEEATVEYITNFANVIKDRMSQIELDELNETYQKVVEKCAQSEIEVVKNLQL